MLVEIDDDEIHRIVVAHLKTLYEQLKDDVRDSGFNDLHESHQQHMMESLYGLELCIGYFKGFVGERHGR